MSDPCIRCKQWVKIGGETVQVYREHSDAAKRFADTYNMHRLADPIGSNGKWIAVALADASSDNTVYDTRREAIRHQHHNEQWYAYACLRPGGMNVCEAESFLRYHRMAYDAGMRLPDPDDMNGGKQLIPRLTREGHGAQLRALRKAISRR